MRLDQALVARGLAASRARAQEMIRAGLARVNGAPALKASAEIAEADALTLAGEGLAWVSRGALKLIAALDALGLSPAGRVVYDLGASTGGFTEVCLTRGAARVYALDVGHGQLHPRLAGDARVVSREGVNVRDLAPGFPPEPAGAIVADLSFISLTKALPPALSMAAPGAWAALLIKPQFEVGPARVGKGGIVKDEAARKEACDSVRAMLVGLGWSVAGLIQSPIAGGDGNLEYLIGALRP